MFWSGISTGLLVLVPLEGPILGRHSLVYISYLGSSPTIKIHCTKSFISMGGLGLVLQKT